MDEKLEGTDVRLAGKVKFFNQPRGFGFIDVDGEDYFVHITDVDGEILLGDEEVSFKPVQGHKGLQAIEVCRVDPPEMDKEWGRVKFYNEEKGYGFIGRDGKADVFAHFTDFEDVVDSEEIVIGAPVCFIVRQGRGGRDRAYEIRFEELE